jgi:hypothetical protein
MGSRVACRVGFGGGLLAGALSLAACSGEGSRLASIRVTPANASIPSGFALQLTAVGTYSDGRTRDLTAAVTWGSPDAGLVALSNAPGSEGLASGLAAGVALVEAVHAKSGVRGSTPLVVTAPLLVALELTPAAPSIALGTSVQLTAMGLFSDGTLQDLTAAVVWSSSDPGVASLDGTPGNQGLAAGVAVGSAVVEALDLASGIAGATALSVTPAVLTALEVTPTAPSIALGTGLAFTAMGLYSDGTAQDLTGSVSWDSSDPAVASVSGAGLAASQSTGTTAISATDLASGIGGSTLLSVTPAVLTALEITPAAPSIALGTELQFTAMGIYSDGTAQDLTGGAQWDSSDPGVAAVSGAGLAASLSQGTTAISATDLASGINGSTPLTITAAVLTGITLSPMAPSMALGTDLQFGALGTFSDGTAQDLTAVLTWSSSDPAVASVSNAPGSAGLVASASVGGTAITALDPGSGISGSEPLTVTAAALVSIAVTPVDPSIALGTSQAFSATGTYTDASTQDLTGAVTWSSSDPAVAVLSNAPGTAGLATSLSVGVALVSALDPASGVGGSTTLSVTPAVLVSIAVAPANPAIQIAGTQPFTATGDYSDGSQQDLTTAVLWSSSASGVASVSNAPGSEGLATGLTAGATVITASDAGSSIDGSTTLSVAADIALRAASGAASASGVASLAIATPAGTQPGDVMVAAVSVRPSSAAITPPGGWTLVRRVDNAAGNSSSLAVYTRVAALGEPASHAWSLSTSTGSAGGIAAFSGVDTATPVDAEAGAPTATGLTHATPSTTATRPRTMLVTAHAFTSSDTWTPPAGMSEAVDVASMAVPNSAGIALEIAHALQAAPGATGSKAAVAGANADTGNAEILALAP